MTTSALRLIQNLVAGTLLFVVFLSFTSDNAQPGFYMRYYALLIALSGTALSMSHSSALRYMRAHGRGFLSFAALVLFITVWNVAISGSVSMTSVNVMICASVGGAVFVLGRVRPAMMIMLVRALITANVIALGYQFFLYLVFGDLSYLHADLFSFSRDRYQLAVGGTFSRFSGYHLEPGSYSTMMALLLIYYRSLIAKMDMMFFVGALAVPMTFSTIGLIFTALIGGVILVQNNWASARNLILVGFGVAALSAGLILGGVVDGLLARFGADAGGDSSLGYKLANLLSYLDFSVVEYLSGLGLYVTDADCVGCGFVKSNGTLFFMVYTLGVLGIVTMGALMWRSAWTSLSCFAFFGILALCRYPGIYPVFWVIYLSLWTWSKPPSSRAHHRQQAGS